MDTRPTAGVKLTAQGVLLIVKANVWFLKVSIGASCNLTRAVLKSCAICLSRLSNAAKLQATVGLQGKDEEQHPQEKACVVLT